MSTHVLDSHSLTDYVMKCLLIGSDVLHSLLYVSLRAVSLHAVSLRTVSQPHIHW